MAKALVIIIVAVIVGSLVYLAAAPRLLHSGASNPQSADAGAQRPSQPIVDPHNPSAPSGAVDNSPPVGVPQSSEQKQQADLEAKRGPFYTWIRTHMRKYLVGWQPNPADPACLDLYLARSDPSD